MIYIDDEPKLDVNARYLYDIKKELETFRHTMVGFGTVLLAVVVILVLVT